MESGSKGKQLMSRYRKTFKEAMAEVQLNEVGYLQSKLNDRQIQNIKKIWQFKTKKDITPAVKKMIKNMDPITQGAIKDAGINLLSDIAEGIIAEGRMSEIDAMQKAGKSAAEIAKLMKLPVKTVKSILGEEDGDSAQDMNDAKPGKEKIREEDEKEKEEDKKKKDKEDIAPDNDVPVETKKEDSKGTEKLEAEIEKKDNEIQSLKVKAETEKAKATKKETEKMVNPETGEPLLQIGVAYKHLKDKMEREKVKKEEVELDEVANFTATMLKTLKKEYEPMRGKKITAARARQLMNILDKLNDANLNILSKANIPFVSSGSTSKLMVRKMKVKVTDIDPFKEEIEYDEDMFEACWTGYKQVGFKKKGGKQVPNCVPEEIEEGRFTKLHNLLIQKGRMAQAKDNQGEKRTDVEIAKQKKMLGINEVLNKDDEKVVSKVKDMLKGASEKHKSQAKELDKALKNEMKKDDAYAIGMAQAKKVMNDEPPLEKKTIKKGHEIADKILNKEETIKEFKKMTVYVKDQNKRNKAIDDLKKQKFKVDVFGDKIHVDGKGADLNKYATDLKNFYGANIDIKKENAPTAADMDRLKKQGMKPKMKNEDHPAKEIYEQIKGLKNKAEKSGMPYGILKKVYDRGMAAWRGGHRPGATQQQWAFARVNSFVTKSSGTWGGADKDLAKQVKGK